MAQGRFGSKPTGPWSRRSACTARQATSRCRGSMTSRTRTTGSRSGSLLRARSLVHDPFIPDVAPQIQAVGLGESEAAIAEDRHHMAALVVGMVSRLGHGYR